MKYYIYIIYDKVANMYGVPMTSINNACAYRHYNNMALEGDRVDYALYLIGEFNADTGDLDCYDTKLEITTEMIKGEVNANESEKAV